MSISDENEHLSNQDAADVSIGEQVLALDRQTTVDSALKVIGLHCLAEVRRNQPRALAGEVEGVHDLRVAIRRLRSVLSAAKPMLADRQYRGAVAKLRWLANIFGPARNWDVFAEELLAPLYGVVPDDHDLKSLSAAVERERQAAYRKMVEVLESERCAATMSSLTRWFATGGWHRDMPWPQDIPLLSPVGDVVPALLDRRHRKFRKMSRQFETLDDTERHQLRIALKKLRYTVELFAGLFDEDQVSAYLQILKPAQNALGLNNDVRIATGLITRIRRTGGWRDDAVSRAEGFLLGWHRRGLDEGSKSLGKQIKRISQAKPFWK